jgi:hypothetical protein
MTGIRGGAARLARVVVCSVLVVCVAASGWAATSTKKTAAKKKSTVSSKKKASSKTKLASKKTTSKKSASKKSSTRKVASKKSSSKKKKRASTKIAAKKKSSTKKAVKPAPSKPPLVLDDPAYPLDATGRALAVAMRDMWTRDAGRLVSVLAEAHAQKPDAEAPLTLMLAVAHAETNGRVLLVSEAGAVGLAQATPVAYLAEGGRGKLYVTDDYATGAWAYIMKKPLNDADRIATRLIDSPSEANFRIARNLLNAAFAVRDEGIEELKVLAPYAPSFEQRIARSDEDNLATLTELEKMIERQAPKGELLPFRERARGRYRAMLDLQRRSWKQYQMDLTRERDAVLRRNYGGNVDEVIRTRAYEVADVLARDLDDRFSPRSMARFLRVHLQTKAEQARALGVAPYDLERVTAGLYNGGSHNIRRMMTGLITRLPETENYMQKVPATRRKLDAALMHRGDTTSVAAAGGR